MDNIKLAETIKAAQTGDQAALTRIYLEYAKPVYFLALKLLKDNEAAEDIAQEVFIYVYQKITELREPGAFRTWLNRITASKCANALRRNREPLSVDIEEVAETDFFEEADPLLVPEKALDNVETTRMIVNIIDTLPTPQRVCVYYYYYEQLTIAQIAEILDANENTVKSRLALARDKIRKELERLNKEEGIRLYSAVPLILTPILKMSLQEFDMPQDVLTGMLDRVTAQVSASAVSAAGQTAANTAAQVASGTAAESALTSAAGKVLGGLGAKIAIVAAGVAVTAGVVFGVVSAVSSWNDSVPAVTREEFASAVAENTELRKRLAEVNEPSATTYDTQDQPTEEALPEPEPEPELESDVSAPAVFYGRVDTNLNLRDNPSTSGEILEMLTSGAVIEIHENLGEWLRVSKDGKSGFVSAEYVTIIGNTPPAAGSSNAAAYKALYDVLKAATDKQGIDVDHTVQESGHGEIVYAELFYFDNGNLPLLLYGEWEAYHINTYLYGCADGVAQLLFSNAHGGEFSSVALASSNSGQLFIIHRTPVTSPEDIAYYYYSISNGELISVLEQYTDYQTWFVNDKQVSEDEYNSAPEMELEIVEIHDIPFSPDTVHAALAELSRLAGIS